MTTKKSVICLLLLKISLVAFNNADELGLNSKSHLNVVIFFAHTDSGKCLDLHENSLDFLNFHQATRIKHNSNEDRNKREPKVGFCKELLKDGLLSLARFCHDVLKMKTAVAAVSSKEMTNDIQEPDDFDGKTRIKRASDNVATSKDNIITSSKHTEVFQIRVKRHDYDEDKREAKKNIKVKIVDDYPNNKKLKMLKPSWDVLDIMKHVRYSFLGDTLQQHEFKDDREDMVDISQLGKEKQDPGLFSMVKSTLDNLQAPPMAHFLMVIFGGHLEAISDVNSATVRSIKHVIESTDQENTLIIVTGSCSEEEEEDDEVGGEHKNDEEKKVPLYARGPKRDNLCECRTLYDIPLVVRKILEENSGVTGKTN